MALFSDPEKAVIVESRTHLEDGGIGVTVTCQVCEIPNGANVPPGVPAKHPMYLGRVAKADATAERVAAETAFGRGCLHNWGCPHARLSLELGADLRVKAPRKIAAKG